MATQKAVGVYPRRGEVYLVTFDPALGEEIPKTRSALEVQNDIANRHSPITIVAAITSRYQEPLYPTEVLIRAREGGLEEDSVVLLNQIRSIDKQRLLRLESIRKVDRALLISLGLIAM